MQDSGTSSNLPELPIELWEHTLELFIDELYLFHLNPYQFEMQTKHGTTALVRQDWHTELGVRAFRNRLALISIDSWTFGISS
ncbi:hypothetical protein FRC15_007828 [Serendipita sp. 397]|nr:hypothetical protein FRC15_007828 [Serendipita sp. 397]KAG8837532.1 hypothetical protein FRC18_008977 [Serendipita sp. 400]